MRGSERYEARPEKTRETPPEALWIRYADIRARGEEDSDLDPEDFRQLIECEMMLSLQENPPIQGIFDPEQELEKVRKLPHGEKVVALELFKDTLVRQRHAYMQCRLFVERTITYDPDTSPEQLMKIGDFFAEQYGFSDLAKDVVRDLIEEYGLRHKKTREFREKHPDDVDIIKELSGVQVEPGTAVVSEGPLSIDIVADRATANRLYARNDRGGGSGRAFLGFQGIDEKNEMYFTVAASDAEDPDNVRTHEQEHVKNKVLRGFFDLDDGQIDAWRNLRVRIRNETDPEVRAALRTEELRIVRDEALDKAKDELTAMFKDGKSSYFYRFAAKDGSSYDYLKDERDRYYQDTDYAEPAHEILVGEYEYIIENAISAFKELRRTGNLTVGAAIAFLTDVPLDQWPSTARHLSENVYKYAR
ncbi:MAG: hypothetical protein AAB804_00495 [Patescibacteria group bacterium]